MATNAVTPESTTGTTLEFPKAGPERDHFMKTGELVPVKEEVKTQAESSPVEDAQAESSTAPEETEAKAEGSEVEHDPAQKPKKRGAEARIIELLEENKRLREAQREKPQADSTPAPQAQELKRPSMDEFQTMQEYEDALEKYHEERATRIAERTVRESEFKRELKSKVNDARQRYENFDDVAAPLVSQLADKGFPEPVRDAIDDSPVFAELLYVIGENEANSEDFIALAKSNPRAAIKRIGALEQLIADELGATAKADRDRDDKGQFKAEKKASKAPPPPTELAGNGGAPPDEVAAAVERNDFRAFKAAEDRRDIARRKGI